MKHKYWVGTRPRGAGKWADATHGIEITDPQLLESIRQMHSRYVKLWNEIAMDESRTQSDYLTSFHEASYFIGGGCRVFGFIPRAGQWGSWVLEIAYPKKFRLYVRGWSSGKNPLRDSTDMKVVTLHWKGDGDDRFLAWLRSEREAHQHIQGETLYR